MEHCQDCDFQKDYLAVLTRTTDRVESVVGVRFMDSIKAFADGEVIRE